MVAVGIDSLDTLPVTPTRCRSHSSASSPSKQAPRNCTGAFAQTPMELDDSFPKARRPGYFGTPNRCVPTFSIFQISPAKFTTAFRYPLDRRWRSGWP